MNKNEKKTDREVSVKVVYGTKTLAQCMKNVIARRIENDSRETVC